VRQALVLEFVKIAAGSSVRIRKMSVKTLWISRPPPKRKKRLPTLEIQRRRSAGHSRKFCLHWPEKKEWQYACRLLGTSSLKEGTMWHYNWREIRY
jgi:hypothetical protein